jgi:hypothetical protein
VVRHQALLGSPATFRLRETTSFDAQVTLEWLSPQASKLKSNSSYQSPALNQQPSLDEPYRIHSFGSSV